MLGGGHLLALEFLADDALYFTQPAFFAGVDYGDGYTGLACAARTAGAMGIYGGVFGQTVVDYMSEVVDIKASGSHVGCHEYTHHAVAEFLHHDIALLLREVAVERLGVIAFLTETVGNLLCVASRAAEDDAVDIGRVVDNALEREIFVAGIDHIVYVLDVGGAFVARANHKLHGVMHVFFCDASDFGRHRGREHQHLALRRHVVEYFIDRVKEAHIEHLVGLVEDYGVHIAELCHSAVDKVDQTTRSRHDDLHAAAQRAYLALDARAAINGKHSDIGKIFGKISQVRCYLKAKLAGGSKDERLRRMIFLIYALQHRQPESGRLAGSCLSKRHNVALFTEQMRYHLRLHGHRLFKTQFLDSLQKRFAYS